ncbi:hypothetical protein B0H17DRAFT_1052104 [Mycena rosella]|uniref:Uncharacterized protein n=1 Tax=Mycena rosella TaxID=1033263 RepID=A0AAD7GNI6_MYCRO|nr:hypothetical protein B0H17DRAFT_1052104 [Mycena rosella]
MAAIAGRGSGGSLEQRCGDMRSTTQRVLEKNKQWGRGLRHTDCRRRKSGLVSVGGGERRCVRSWVRLSK